MTTFPIEATADAEVSGFIAGMASSAAALSTFATAAATATLAVGAIAIAGLVPAVNAARDFETEMVKLITLVGIGEKQMGDFSESILELAPGLGAAPTDMARALFAITSGGERTTQAIDLLTASARASRIGMGDMATIARVGTAALQAFADQNLQAEEAIDVMVATVREGNLVAGELATAFGRVIGIAATMGVTFGDVGGFIATFTRLGVNAEIAATSLRSTLFAILSPGKEARKAFQEIGLSVEEMRRKIQDDGLTPAMIDMLQAAEGNFDAIGKLIPNVRALSGVLGTAGVQAEQFVGISDRVNNAAGITAEGMERVAETTDDAFVKLFANMKTFATRVGGVFLEPLEDVAKALNDTIDATESFGTKLFRLAAREGGSIKDLLFPSDGTEDAAGFQGSIEELEDQLRQLTDIGLQNFQQNLAARRALIGQQQIDFDPEGEISANELLARSNRTHAIQQALNTVIGEREALRVKEVEGIRVVVGATDQEKAATDRLITSLEEQLLRIQERDRELLISRLVSQNATDGKREEALAIFDLITATEAEIEAKKKAAEQGLRNQKIIEDGVRRRNREFARNRAQLSRQKEEERAADATFGVELELDKISAAFDRQERLAESMAREYANSIERMIRSTEDFGDAFADMVTRILAEVARLKIEEAIIGPILRALIKVPDAPGAFPSPDPDLVLGANTAPSLSLPGLSSASFQGGGGATVVNQNITFAPNLIDARSGRQFLNEHAGDMAEIVGKSAARSVSLSRKIGGRR